MLALVGGFIALDQRREAEQVQRNEVARGLAAASVAALDEDPELGILLALEAVRQTRGAGAAVPREVESALHRAVTSSRLITTVPGLGGSVDWHPDGTAFVTEGPEESGVIDVRDASTGASVHAFSGHEADINDVAFSSDGVLLATSGDDGRVRVWDWETGALHAQIDGTGEVWGISFSSDGSHVAAGWVDEQVVRVLDLSTDEPPLEVTAATLPLGDSTSFSPDGRRLAIATVPGVMVVDVADGERLVRFGTDTDLAVAVEWSPDGRWIASASQGRPPRVTDASTGELRFELPEDVGDVLNLDWAAEAPRLATGARDGMARVFELTEHGAAEQVSLASADGVVGDVAFSPDGNRLLTGALPATSARIWEVGVTGGAEWINLPVPASSVTDASFTVDGNGLVTSGRSAAAVAWDLASGTAQTSLGRGQRHALGIEVSPDGGLVATISDEHAPRVHVWDRWTGEQQFTVELTDLRPSHAAWNPDGTKLAVAGLDARETERITVVDRAGRHVATLEGEDGFTARDVAFTPDGRRLVTTRRRANRDDSTIDGVQVWDWRRGQVLTSIPAFARGIAVHPSGTKVAAIEVAGGVKLWDIDTGDRLATLNGHDGEVVDVAFSPDGESIGTAGVDGTVRLWSAQTGAEVLVLHGHDGPAWSVAFDPDGDRLVSTGAGLARVWALDIDDLVRIAESKVARPLTIEECQQYLDINRCDP